MTTGDPLSRMATGLSPRRYMELLTPVLHRRFVRAAGVALVLCYIESILVGEVRSWFWSWFPLGRAGIRALLLFISALLIFLLRFEQRHIGGRNSISPIATLARLLHTSEIPQTFFCYLLSAWWFSEVYFWSASGTADLGWISNGKSWERKRLNERPIYLRCVFFGLAGFQTFIHIYYDYNRFPLHSIRSMRSESTMQSRTESKLFNILLTRGLHLLPKLAFQAACVAATGPLIYGIFLRRYAWTMSYRIASSIWDIPATGDISYIPPYHVTLIFRSFSASFILLGLWQFSNLIFSLYMMQAPVKNGRPLTDASVDPNGSLLKGLTAKKQLPKNFAMLELLYIGRDFADRRRAIFSDIDRPNGSTWSQVMHLCLSEIQAVNTRVSEFQAQPQQQPQIQQSSNQMSTLPSITPPLRQEPVINAPSPPANRREKLKSAVGSFAKSLGDSPQSRSPSAKQYLETARSKLLTQEQQQTLSIEGIKTEANPYLQQVLRTPIGWPLRQTFERRVSSVILAEPYSTIEILLNSIEGLSMLAVGSLKEDSYGKVAQDVPLIIRAYISTQDTIRSFVHNTTPHWTDIKFKGERRIADVEAIEEELRLGIGRMIENFGAYSGELGLSVDEIKNARAIAGLETEK